MERIGTFGDDERRPVARQVGLGCLYLSYLTLFSGVVLGILALWLSTGTAALIAAAVGVLLGIVGVLLLVLTGHRRPREGGEAATVEQPHPVVPSTDPSRHDVHSG